MNCDHRKIAGSLIFLGGVLCILGIIVSEALYPGYSTSRNYISDLGVGPSALIFNSSLFFLGLLAVVSVYFVQRVFNFNLFSFFLALAGIGVMGVGLFTEDAGVIHTFFSLVTFLFAGLSAVLSYKLEEPPLSYFSVMLGGLSLSALILFGFNIYLGLGKGGMERMIAYPELLWTVGLGSYFLSFPKKRGKTDLILF